MPFLILLLPICFNVGIIRFHVLGSDCCMLYKLGFEVQAILTWAPRRKARCAFFYGGLVMVCQGSCKRQLLVSLCIAARSASYTHSLLLECYNIGWACVHIPFRLAAQSVFRGVRKISDESINRSAFPTKFVHNLANQTGEGKKAGFPCGRTALLCLTEPNTASS